MNLLIKSGYLKSALLKMKEEKWFQTNFFMSFFSIFIKSCLCYALFHSLFLNSTKVNATEITLYFIVVNIVALSISAAQSVAYDFMENINTGAIIPHLLRPNNYIISHFLNNLTLVAVRLVLNMAFIWGSAYLLGLKMHIAYLSMGFLSNLFGFTILYLIQAIIGCFSVWLHDITRLRDVIYSLLMLFGGRLVPSDLLFSGLKKIVYFTPLPYVYDIPTKILIGHASFRAVAIQVVWIVVFGALYIFVFKRWVKNNIEFGG